jgi:chitodextrinase
VSATNSGCTGAQGTASITIGEGGGGNPGSMTANFTISPATPKVGDTITLDGAPSTGSPTGFTWTLPGDLTKTGQVITVTFASAGLYPVSLEVSKLGSGQGCQLGVCVATITKAIAVTSGDGGNGGPSNLVAEFTTSPASPKAGEPVTLDGGPSQGSPTAYLWSLPGGVEKSGKTVTFTFPSEGSHAVTLVVSKQGTFVGPECNFGFCSVSATKNVTVGPPAQGKPVLLPWIAQTSGALVQSSDLYVHNPGSTAADVPIEFRKRGAPEANPPRVTRTIEAGSTLYSGDALKELFNRENIGGFISFTVDAGAATPVVTSFNTTFLNGQEFGQTVSGETLVPGAAATVSTQHLVGLVGNGDRLTYFGVSNPNDQPATFGLRFFDKTGTKISESSQDFTVSRFGQVQFQAKQIEDDFGVSDEADFRVEVESKTGGALVPYASILRVSSGDPSFLVAGATRGAKVYLVGALSTPGLNNSVWQTDAVLANVSSQAITADMTFTPAGLNSVPTAPLHVSLTPGSTERLENVIASELGINNAVGVLTLVTTSGGAFPILQGESYENTNPAKRFGQSMMAVSEADAAGVGQSQYLTGLRQDTKNRTTFWVFNPGDQTGEYEIVYRDLAGKVVGTVAAFRLGPGKLRQFSPGQHPLPSTGAPNGFQVQIKVKSGKVLGAAQVVKNLTNDPAYIQGEVR